MVPSDAQELAPSLLHRPAGSGPRMPSPTERRTPGNLRPPWFLDTRGRGVTPSRTRGTLPVHRENTAGGHRAPPPLVRETSQRRTDFISTGEDVQILCEQEGRQPRRLGKVRHRPPRSRRGTRASSRLASEPLVKQRVVHRLPRPHPARDPGIDPVPMSLFRVGTERPRRQAKSLRAQHSASPSDEL